MVSSSRGSYARLCIQVDLDKPLINTVKIGRLRQKVMYEGISSLCFCCERIGHKKENCCNEIQPKKVEAAREEIMPPSPKESQMEDTSGSNYGAWMIVTRKKSSVRNGLGHGPNQLTHQGGKTSKDNLVLTRDEVGPRNSGTQTL